MSTYAPEPRRRDMVPGEDLHWSETGEIACHFHAPYPGSDTWLSGRWRRMTSAEIAECAAVEPRMSECEACRVISETDRRRRD